MAEELKEPEKIRNPKAEELSSKSNKPVPKTDCTIPVKVIKRELKNHSEKKLFMILSHKYFCYTFFHL